MTVVTQTTTQLRRPTGAATARRTVILTGVQPTGDLHLGNYVGAIRPLAQIAAHPARDVYVFVADLHALNGRPTPQRCASAPGDSLPHCSPAASTVRTSTCTARAGCPPSRG
jgi:tRNA synthetases class I (W and Y)